MIVRPFNIGNQSKVGYMRRSDGHAMYLTVPVEHEYIIWGTADSYKADSVLTLRRGDKIVAKVEW